MCFTSLGLYNQNTVRFRYLGQFSPNNSRKVPIARAWGENKGVFREFEVWPNFTFEIVVLYAITCYILPRYIESLLHCARDTVVRVESTVVFGWSVLGARTSAFILMTLAGWCTPGVARSDEDWELTLISSLRCCTQSFVSLKLEQKLLFYKLYSSIRLRYTQLWNIRSIRATLYLSTGSLHALGASVSSI